MLWLDPTNPEAFPAGLVEAVERGGDGRGGQRSVEEQLRVQMRADALRPLDDEDGEDLPKKADSGADDGVPLPPRTIEEATQFLQLNVSFLRSLCVMCCSLFHDVGLTWSPCTTISPWNASTVFCDTCVQNTTTASGAAHNTRVPTRCRKSVRDQTKICTTRWNECSRPLRSYSIDYIK